MKKRHIIATALSLSIITGIALLIAFKNDDNPGAPPAGRGQSSPMVETTPARRGSIARTIDLTGEVTATNHVVISSCKEGPITYYPWREGDKVDAGEKLVEIEREVHRAELQAARAALGMAQARYDDLRAGARPEEIQKAEAEVKRWESTLNEARAAYERRKDLLAGDFVSLESFEQARERLATAEAQRDSARETLAMLKAGPTKTELAVQRAAVQEAQAKVELTEAHLAECVIRAPFSGMVTQTHARRGGFAAARTPLIEIADMNSLVIRFAASESFTAIIAEGMEIKVTLDAYPARPINAKIVRIYPELDRRLRSRTMEAELLEDMELAPGMFARVSLELARVKDVVIAPVNAIIESNNGTKSVFIFHDGKAHQREVSTGVSDGVNVQITDGLEAGEMVVTVGQRNLRDGAEARTRRPDSGRPGAGGER